MNFMSYDMPSSGEAKSDYFMSSCMKREKVKKKDIKKKRKNRFILHHSIDEVHMEHIIQKEINRITHMPNIQHLTLYIYIYIK